MIRNWLVVVYNSKEELRSAWFIKERTKKEAESDAELGVALIEGDVSDWDLLPFAIEKGESK